MSNIKHAVISAAGIGSRLGLNRPKCLIEVGGRTLLDYHVQRLAEVENIWLVVGFQEETVIEHALSLRSDIIIARNPDYARTNTLQSIYRVARHLKERFLALDADTVIEDSSFRGFLAAARECRELIGVSRYTTSDGVRALVDGEPGQVIGFSRTTPPIYEWTGIAVMTPEMVIDQPIYVYQVLENYLPIPAYEINAFDIDTTSDLDMARNVVSGNWLS